MIPELIEAFIVVLCIIYIYYKYVTFNFWRKRDVFYIKPAVPTGNITALVTGKAQVGIFFQDIYMKYKDHRAIGTYIFFKPNLVIADLDLIRIILIKDFKSFHDRGIYYNEKVDPLSGHLFFTPGKKWQNMRVKMTNVFTSKKMKQMFTIVKECGEELTKFLENEIQIRESIEIKDIFARYSTDVIMSTAFGIKSNCIQEPNNEYRTQGKKIFEINKIYIFLFMLRLIAPQIMNFFPIPLTDRHITSFYMYMFQKNVEYRQGHNIVRHDFMNLLIQFMERGYVDPDDDDNTIDKSSTVRKLTMAEAAAQSYVFFVAGFETSSTVATFALYELAQHHDVQDKLHEEIDEILTKHGDLTYEAMMEMTYLHKVLKETMRKYPPLPMLNRICTKDINLPTMNIHLPKGTLTTIPVFGIHRDPSIYPDPDRFDPERFNADEIAKRHPYAYLPFGGGPRHCIGERFGYMQTKIGLVSLLSKYKFKLHSRTRTPLIFDEKFAVLSAKDGIYLIVEPRERQDYDFMN